MAAIAIGLHFQQVRAAACPAMRCGAGGGGGHRAYVHAIHLFARDAPRGAVLAEIARGAGPLLAGAHGIFVVLDDEDAGQLEQRRQIQALVYLALVGRALAEIGRRDMAITAIPVGEGQPGAEGDLRAHDAVPAVERLLAAEHVHRPALAARITAGAAGQLRHHAARFHAAGQHVAMVAIAGNDLVAGDELRLDAHHHRFLPDVEVAEPADQPHAVELARLLLEPADQQHRAIGADQLLLVESGGYRGLVAPRDPGCGFGVLDHSASPSLTHIYARPRGSARPQSLMLQREKRINLV